MSDNKEILLQTKKRRPNVKQRKRLQKQQQQQQQQEGKKESNHEPESRSRSKSRSKSRSNSRSRSRSISRDSNESKSKRKNQKPKTRNHTPITDDAILRHEIKKPNLNLNDFQELEELGGGRSSGVKLALYGGESPPKYVALKILDKKAYQQDKKMISYAYHEKQMLHDIHSPFKIAYLGKFKTKSFLYLVTEYVAGYTLINLIQTEEESDSSGSSNAS